MLTRLGQKVAMLWMDTNPTKRETGKSQNMVKALMNYCETLLALSALALTKHQG